MEKSIKVISLEDNKGINKIALKVLNTIQGESFDDLIPALTMVLADVGLASEVDIDKYLNFIGDSVRKIVVLKKAIEEAMDDPTKLH